MSPVQIKLIIGGLVLASATGYLGISAAKSGWVYFVDVDRYVESSPRIDVRSRLHGLVGAERFDLARTDLRARFELVGASHRVPVEYRGAIPDLFQVGREVVVEGAMDERGVFQADTLMTKCSSKYEGHEERAETAGSRE
jgi:cytochrome c-type biogenesis protein CcmE